MLDVDTRDAGAASAAGLPPLFELDRFLSAGRRHPMLILSMLALGAGLASLYVAVAPLRYKATAVVLVDPHLEKLLPSDTTASGYTLDSAVVESQVEVLGSITLLERVADHLGLADDPDFARSAKPSWWRPLLGEPAVTLAPSQQKLLLGMQQALTVHRRGITNALEVNFIAGDPEKAARVTNALVEGYIEDQSSLKSGNLSDASDWLNSRIAMLRKTVETSESKVSDFKARNNIIDVGFGNSGFSLSQRQTQEISSQLIIARARARDLAVKLADAESALGSSTKLESLSATLGSTVLAGLRGQYSTAMQRDADLSSQLLPGHPALAASRSQLRAIEKQIKAEVSRLVANIRVEHDGAVKVEKSLETSLTQVESNAVQNDTLRTKLRNLQHEADSDRQIYTEFLGRAKETSEQKTLQRPDARILSRAFPPSAPTSPPAPLLVALGSLGGLGLGLMMARSRENRRTTKAPLPTATAKLADTRPPPKPKRP